MSGPPIPAPIQKSINETKVDYVQLGTSGLRISVPIFGTMGLGSSQWMPWVFDEEKSLELLKGAYDRGINTWDTANMYSNGVNEEVVGKALKKFNIPREKVVLMTKIALYVADEPGVFAPMFGQQMGQTKDYVNQGGESPSALLLLHYRSNRLISDQAFLEDRSSRESTLASAGSIPHTSIFSRFTASTPPHRSKKP